MKKFFHVLVVTLALCNGEEPKFSTTQTIDEKVKSFVNLESHFEIDWTKIVCEPPADNRELEAEILVKLQKSGLNEFRASRIREQVAFTPESLLNFRPSFVNDKIILVVDNPNHPSYPSGHATQGHLFCTLASVFEPKRGAELQKLGKEIGTNREFAGVHYPSDTEAGVMLSKKIISELVKNDKFQILFFAAAKEWGTEEQAAGRFKLLTVAGISKTKK